MPLSSPFIHQALATNKIMLITSLALLPGLITQFYYFGYGVLINVFLCTLFALLAEAFVLKLRQRNITQTLSDNAALLTGILLGLALPPSLPFWMSLIGVSFAVIFAKQLYGGLGQNPFNPAMTGYVLLLISFPVEMTTWLPAKTMTNQLPSFTEIFQLIFLEQTIQGKSAEDFSVLADGFTMATPLDHIKTEFTRAYRTTEILANTNLITNINACIVINLSYLAGGLFLLAKGVIRPHIPLAIITSLSLTSYLLYQFEPQTNAPPWVHLMTGATMMGAWFIATDPVSACTTPRGRIIYGLLIGFIIVIIRVFGGYPDAVAFSVLILNLAAPTIDHYTKPTIYGHNKGEPSHD